MRKCIRAIICMLLAFTMIMPTALPVAADSSYGFTDFPTGWSAPAMAHAVENGIIKGKNENKIAPKDYLTRAEMGTIINRAFGATIGKDISAFSDVAAGRWYYDEIKKSYNMQTMYGDSGGTMRPDAPIIREEAIAIVARAMVLSGYSPSNLDKFVDKAKIAGWAVDSVASMTANGYVNGNSKSMVSPKAYITREEFAQLIYNIVKHYYNPNAKSDTYEGNLMLNKPDISLENITVNGDLILGDGVGESKITLTNIKIKGRLLVRGAAQITLKNVTTGKGVVVKNVNGTVHFDNYRDEKVFDGVVEHTSVTYKKRSLAPGGSTQPSTPTPTPTPGNAIYKVEHYQEALDGNFALFETETLSAAVNSSVTAVAKTYEGFSEDALNASRVPTGIVSENGTLVLKLYYTRNSYNIVYNYGEAGGSVVVSLKFGANVDLSDPSVTAPAGKYFAGWFDKLVGGNQIGALTVPVDGTTIYAQWSDIPPVNFTVRHFQQNITDDLYPATAFEEEIKTAVPGKTVKAQDFAKSYTGFTADLVNSADVTVAADGSTILSIYYTRNRYNVTYNYGEAGGSNTVSYKYGADIDLSDPLVTAPAGKYFAGWFDKLVGGNQIGALTVPENGTTIYAHWSEVPPVNFTVRHFQQNITDDLYPSEAFEEEIKRAIPGNTVKAQNFAKSYTGFTADLVKSADVTVAADGSTILSIYYTRNRYNVTYNYGEAGGQGTVSLKYGANVNLSAPAVPAPAGKEFAGWFNAPIGGTKYTNLTVPAGNVTIYAQWKPISSVSVNFTVEHYQQNIDGTYPADATERETKSAVEGTAVKAEDYDKAYTGFTFDAAASSDIIASSGEILKIYYTRNTYTFVFNYEGATSGNTESSKTFSYGEAITGLPVPSKGEQYAFGGWYTATGTKIEGDILGTVITADSTNVYAYWIQKYPYTVKYLQENANDDNYTVVVADTKTLYGLEGEVVTVTNDKSYTGFYYDTASVTTGTVNAAGNLVIELKYKRETYTVTYNFNEGASATVHTVTLKYEENVDLAFKPTVTVPNMYFAGWYDAAGNQVNSLKTPIGGTTIYAYWSKNPSYTVKHYKEALDGTYPETDVVTENIQAGKDATVNAVYKTDADSGFEGFNANMAHASRVESGVNDGTLVLKLYYTRKIYTISFDVDGGSAVSDEVYKYGQPFVEPSTTKTGYKVEGWYTGTGTRVLPGALAGRDFTGTLYVKWTPVPVNFTVKHFKQEIDGTYPSVPALEVTKQADTDSVVNAVDYKTDFEGFEFDPTSPSVTVLADGTAVLVIRYTRNSYDVVYNYGAAGGSKTVSYKYEQYVDLSAPSVTAPANQYFAGWYTDAGCTIAATALKVPVGGTTIYAKWTDNPKYLVKHHKENLTGGYDVEYEYIPADYNATVTAVAKTDADAGFEGFDYSHGDAGLTGTNDGSLEFNLYYTRKTYTVTFETGEGTPVASKVYKHGETFTVPSSKIVRNGETIYEAEGWYTNVNDADTQITSGSVAGKDFGTVTLYPKWKYVWAGVVEFVAEVTDADLENDEFSVLVKISNNPVGISSYALTLGFEEGQVVPLLDNDNNIVTDLKGFGADTASVGSKVDAGSITVSWDNGNDNESGDVNLFKIRFKIIGTKADENLEDSSSKISLFGMRRAISLIPGLESLPFTLVANKVVTKAIDGSDISVDNTTKGDGLEPYAVEHYKENAEDDGYTKVYTQYGHAISGDGVTAQYRDAYFNQGFKKIVRDGYTVESVNPIPGGGAILKLYYERQRYKVNFDYQGATRVDPAAPQYAELKVGAKVWDSLPAEDLFAKTDYNFSGWYTQSGTKVDESYKVPVGGVTLYAHWTQTAYKVEHYQQNINDNGYTLKDTEEGQAKAGTPVTATAKEYFGFNAPATMPSAIVAKDGSTVIKVYYDRKVYAINYDFGGGSEVGTYKDKNIRFGEKVTLAKAEKTDYYLAGWKTDNHQGNPFRTSVTFNKGFVEKYLATNNVLNLYAVWVDDSTPMAKYVVEHYKETVDGIYPSTATETEDEVEVALNTTLIAEDYAKEYEGFEFDKAEPENIQVREEGKTYILKIYYKRNVYTLNYNYCGADKEGIKNATFKYGQTITLPKNGTYSKTGFIPTGWYKTEAYNEADLVDESLKIEELVDIANGAKEATIYVKWDNFYTVTFLELGNLRHTAKVYPEGPNTVDQAEIDTAYGLLVAPYTVGYRKDASVSAVYAENPYEHKIYGNWYYYEDGKYILFTDKTVVNKDMTVRYMFRKLGLELNINKISQIIEPTFEVPFEEDTRVLDTLKDSSFLFEEKLLTAWGAIDLDSKANRVNDKFVNLLASKGFEVTPGRVVSDDGEIMKQHIKFNGFAYLDEAQVKTVVVKAIKETFKNDPLRLRGVIDEMMQEKDPDVIQVMDDMLVSMLSGSDSARIKGIIADAVEKEVANDTTGEFKQKIKDIIVGQLDAGNVNVETSVKNAINDYFMNDANDAKIKEIVKDLINDAFATDDDSDPVRAFVMDYIKTYLNENPTVLDDMIRDMGETLDKNNPDDAHIIELIEEVLDTNVPYLEKIVDDAIENLHNTVGEPVHNFIVEAIEKELLTDDDELDILIDEIANTQVEDLKSVLVTVMDDKDTFKTIVEDAIEDEDIFKKVIKTALDNTGVFETIVRDLCNTDEAFYKMLVDIALSSTTLTDTVKDVVVEDEDALVKVLKEVASEPALKAEMVDEILVAVDSDLKDQLTNPLDSSSDYYADVKDKALKQAEDEIIDIVENGINEIDHPDYWPKAFEKAMEVAEANVVQNLIGIGVDPNGSLWDSAYADAMAKAAIDVTAELNVGIDETSIYYNAAVEGAKNQAEKEINDLLATGIAEGSKYWDVAYNTAKAILKEEIETNFENKIDELQKDGKLDQVKAWAQNSLDDPEVEEVIEDLLKDLATSTEPEDADLKASIINSVIDTIKSATQLEKEGLVDDIINELLKPENATVKETVATKAIDVLNLDENATVKSEIVDGVLDDILGDDTLKGNLIDRLKTKAKDPAQTDFRLTVVDKAIDAVINDSVVNHRAIEIINNLIETDIDFKAETITHIVEYILENDTARAEAMEKVIEMIEDPTDTSHKDEAIDFAFNTLKGDTVRREEIADKFLTSILGDNTKRQDMATDVIDIMFKNVSLRDRILDLGFEQMFSNSDTIKEIVELALDELIADDVVRRDMILTVIETESGRDSILDILFDELERDATFLDKMIDIAMEGKYGDMVDFFVADLINNGKIQINPDNRQITEEIIIPMLDDMTLDTVMAKLPATVTNVLPNSVLETIFNKFKSKARGELVEGVEEAEKGNSKDIKVMIDHDIDIVNSILIPAYNKVFPRVTDKAEDFYYYGENQYIRAIVDMLDPEVIFDHTQPASEMGTGYRVRNSRYYYEMHRNTLVLADDAGQWYLDNISDEQIDKVIGKFMTAYTKVITKANSLVGGRIPEDKLETIIGYVEKAIDKRQSAYDVSTHKIVEGTEKVLTKIIGIAEEKLGTVLDPATVIEVVISKDGVALNDKDITIDVNVKGYSFKLSAEEIAVAGKTVDISAITNKIGGRSVTIKFCKDDPYAYSIHVNSNSVKMSAYYEG